MLPEPLLRHVYFQVVGDADPSVGVVYGAEYFRYEMMSCLPSDPPRPFSCHTAMEPFYLFTGSITLPMMFLPGAFRRLYVLRPQSLRLTPVYELHFIKIHPAAFGHLAALACLPPRSDILMTAIPLPFSAGDAARDSHTDAVAAVHRRGLRCLVPNTTPFFRSSEATSLSGHSTGRDEGSSSFVVKP